uniref:Odorant binding protein 5 n=1 Tax=Dendroctonus adjunctus TaxID=77157 RepID=A0A7U3W594_9CUCU|nr:Odorant binding protein 5 [Dendroctonus adjunctus]
MILTCSRTVILILTIFAINSLVAVSLNVGKPIALKQFLKNQTQARNNGDGNKDNEEKENILRTEARKLLKQCDGERNRYGDDTNNKFSASNGENNRNNFRQDRQSNGYGNNNNNNESSGNSWSSNRSGTTYGSQNNEDEEWNMFRSPKRYDTGSNTAESSYGPQHFNRANNENRNPYSSNNMNYETDHRTPSNTYNRMSTNGDQLNSPNTDYRTHFNQNPQSSGFGESSTGYQASSSNAFDMRNSYGPNSDGFNRVISSDNDCRDNVHGNCGRNMVEYNSGRTFGPQISSHRNKRYSYFNRESKERNESSQCVSQCIFDYLRLLDYDKTPSETLLIKWLQDHVTGNDMDRIKELRKARSCFSKLTASDTDDGCEMTTELSKCLELELE